MHKFTLLLTAFLLTSCASEVNFQIPLTRFETPETHGRFLKGGFGINYGVSHKMTTAEVLESTMSADFGPEFSPGTGISKSKNFNLNLDLGLLSRLDFVFKSHFDGANVYGAKYQFLGATASESKTGWKGSFQGTYGMMDEDQGSLSLYSFIGAIRHYKGHIKLKTYDTSLNFGYRFNKSLIAYFNSVYSYYDTESTLTATGYPTKHIRGAVQSYGGLLGIRLGSVDNFAVLKLEAGLLKSSWENQINLTSIPLGVGVDFSW